MQGTRKQGKHTRTHGASSTSVFGDFYGGAGCVFEHAQCTGQRTRRGIVGGSPWVWPCSTGWQHARQPQYFLMQIVGLHCSLGQIGCACKYCCSSRSKFQSFGLHACQTLSGSCPPPIAAGCGPGQLLELVSLSLFFSIDLRSPRRSSRRSALKKKWKSLCKLGRLEGGF